MPISSVFSLHIAQVAGTATNGWSSTPLVPLGVAGPIAGIVVLCLIAYWFALGNRTPRSRRRIRRANTVVHFVLVCALVYAASMVAPGDQPIGFILGWTAVGSVTLITLVLAFADIANNRRVAIRERANRRQVVRADMARKLIEAAQQATSDESGAPNTTSQVEAKARVDRPAKPNDT